MNKIIFLVVNIILLESVTAVLRDRFSVRGSHLKAVNAKAVELLDEKNVKNGAEAMLESDASSLIQISASVGVQTTKVTLRNQTLQNTGRLRWSVNETKVEWDPSAVAFVIVDMWDKHWCPSATERVGSLAVFINSIANAARAKGSLIIHAPSSCSDFYRDSPQRKWVLSLPDVAPPSTKPHFVPQFPIDASNEGCDVPGYHPYNAWTRQHPLITIDQNDAIIDDEKNGQTLFNVISAKKISHLVYLGVHANMCIMNRSFALRKVVGWGINAVVVREAVDTMYEPSSWPYVSHEESVDLMLGYIERHWVPSVSAYDWLYPR